jgi:hypothetical protein
MWLVSAFAVSKEPPGEESIAMAETAKNPDYCCLSRDLGEAAGDDIEHPRMAMAASPRWEAEAPGRRRRGAEIEAVFSGSGSWGTILPRRQTPGSGAFNR